MRKDKKIEKNSKKTKAIIAIAIAVGIVATISTGSYAAYVNAQERDVHKDLEEQIGEMKSPIDVANSIKQQNPPAEIAMGKAAQVLQDMPLKVIVEQANASRPDDIDPQKSTNDTGINVTLYSGNATQTVAISVENTNLRPIFITGLVISGFVRGDFPDSAVESVYRPIISDPSDVVGATTTKPQVLQSGETVTAHIQGTLEAEGYSALACYSYQPPPLENAEDATMAEFRADHYCNSLPLTWIK